MNVNLCLRCGRHKLLHGKSKTIPCPKFCGPLVDLVKMAKFSQENARLSNRPNEVVYTSLYEGLVLTMDELGGSKKEYARN